MNNVSREKKSKLFFLFVISIFSIFLFFINFKKIRIIFHIHCFKWANCNGQSVSFSEIPLKLNKGELSLITTNGSSRATAYSNLNKIVKTNNGFAIIWLNKEGKKFKLKFRLFDENNYSKKVYDLGEVYDNHGAGSISMLKKHNSHCLLSSQ